MLQAEIDRERAYHDRRCEQQRRRIREARSERAAAVHARLLHLHQMMALDLATSCPAETVQSAD